MSDDTTRAPRIVTARRAAVGLMAATALAGLAFASTPTGPDAVAPAAPSPLPQVASTMAPAAVAPAVVTAGAGVRLGARLDRSRVLVGGDGIVRAELTLAAEQAADATQTVPSDFVVVLDRSSSMAGAKFVDAKGALDALIGRLRPTDRLSVISYSSDARVDVPLALADPESVATWRADLSWLAPGGSTNIGAALDLAHSVVQSRGETARPARVLLLSDGEPTAGDTGAGSLTARARRAASTGYVLGAVGIGLHFNELLMAAMADAGTGNFHSLHAEGGLEAVLAAEFDAARGTVASGLAVTLLPAEGVRVIDAAGYPLELATGGVTFRPGGLFAGQTRRVWVTLKVPVDRPVDARALGRIGLSFARGGRVEALPPTDLGAVAAVADEARFVAGLDKQAWETSVVDGRFADIEKKLAAHVRDGDAAAARDLLDEHARQTAALNRVVGSAAVDTHLVEVARRRAALDDAFTGADQAHKRNLFSKFNTASGWTRSRSGSLR